MSTKHFTKLILLPFAIVLVACGNLPAAGSQAQSQSVSQHSSPVADGAPSQSGTGTGESAAVVPVQTDVPYPVVDTNQGKCYDNNAEIACPTGEQAFFGQDAQYSGNQPRYQDNGDGTLTDLVTGLMWQQDPGEKMTYEQAVARADTFNLASYTDWRLPSIKELYSLILFNGTDVSACMTGQTCDATPFIDTRYFNFSYGDTSAGERVIDSQFASSTKYVSTTMNGNQTVFGVNFADGRIKGYPINKTFYVLYARGNSNYGKNNFVDNGNGTVTDNATGLTWTQNDSGAGMNWESALNYCESLDYAGASDWRLPNVKELQSIVDYSRSPDTTNSAAIDPIFDVTIITNEGGQRDYPFYWSSTTHADSSGNGAFGAYVSFGRALGYMNNTWIDVHGAGAQRSDPKTGSAADFPTGHGPQGDAIRVDNYVRCVRGGNVSSTPNGTVSEARPSIQVESAGIQMQGSSNGMPPLEQGQGGQPPQGALDACLGLGQGAACTVNTPNGTITGSCQTPPQSSQLACVPAGGPPRQ